MRAAGRGTGSRCAVLSVSNRFGRPISFMNNLGCYGFDSEGALFFIRWSVTMVCGRPMSPI